MSDFDIYFKRLNRYGTDYPSRLQNQREREFERKLTYSVYRLDFPYGDTMEAGTLEPLSQDNTKTMAHLLTRTRVQLEPGTILMLDDANNQKTPWMVYYLEHIKASGYNRYTLIRMTHYLTWTARDGSTQSSWAYVYGQEDNMLKDEIKSRSRMNVLYRENLKLSFMVMPKNPYIKKDVYFEIGEGAFKEGYVITGYDLLSTPGVEFVSYDPVYLYDNSPAPTRPEGDTSDDYYWLEGGEE